MKKLLSIIIIIVVVIIIIALAGKNKAVGPVVEEDVTTMPAEVEMMEEGTTVVETEVVVDGAVEADAEGSAEETTPEVEA